MTKRLMVKVGEYQKDGQTKGEYVRIGVIMSSSNGEYALLDPTVNLAGCLMKQRIMNAGKETKGKGDMLMCSIFTDEKQAPQNNSSGDDAPAGDFDDRIPF